MRPRKSHELGLTREAKLNNNNNKSVNLKRRTISDKSH